MTNLLERFVDFATGEVTADVDNASVQTGELFTDSDILVVGPAGGLIHRRDPSASSTPVQDAIASASSAGGGVVFLPPGSVDDSGPVQPADFVHVKGRGYGGNNASIVNITGGGAGLQVPSGGANYGSLMGFRVTNGSGLGNDTGAGLEIGNQFRQFDVLLRFDDWTGAVVGNTGGAMFENRFHRLHFQGCDAGGANGLMDLQSVGPANLCGHIIAYPTDSNSASGSTVLFSDNTTGHLHVGTINIGGTPKWAVDRRGLEYLEVGAVNYEGSPPSTPDRIIYNGREKPARIGFVKNGNTVDNVYFLNSGDLHMGRIENAGTINNDRVRVNTDIGESAIYDGVSTDVNNATGGTLSAPVSCLGDLTTVT